MNEEKQEELGEKYLEEATQDYSYKNPGTYFNITLYNCFNLPDGNFSVLCEDTDEETDDESKEVETGSAANGELNDKKYTRTGPSTLPLQNSARSIT